MGICFCEISLKRGSPFRKEVCDLDSPSVDASRKGVVGKSTLSLAIGFEECVHIGDYTV